MKKILRFMASLTLGLAIITGLNAQDRATYYEKSGGLETPRYQETIDYCKLLAESSEQITYTSFGMSPQGRELPLLIADANGNHSPEEVKSSGNTVLLIEAGIHPGEIEGKDAGLMFLRDLVIHEKYPGLLDDITILFIPILNVDGHERFGPYNRINQNGPLEMGWRTNAQNLNLNRDFLKACTPEIRSWLKLFNEWLPDFFMDIHATDGADYQYASSYALEILGGMDDNLTAWSTDSFIPTLESGMEEASYPIFPYVMFRRWHDPRSGLRASVAPPRLSQGYTTQQNRVGLLVENHMLKDYKTRVNASYEIIKITCEILKTDGKLLQKLNREADLRVADARFRMNPFALDYEAGGDSIMVTFRGVEYDVLTSDLTGGDWFVYHNDQPVTYELPYFNDMVPAKTVMLPEAYIIPPQWSQVITRLEIHGIEYRRLKEPATISVESYRFSDPDWNKTPYEGLFPVNTSSELISEDREFPAGSVVIDMNQRTARVIAHILEPEGPDSYLYWGFFNAIFEQKEYSETYVMEVMAREMLEKDPSLRNEFDMVMAENPHFKNSSWLQLNWFYSKTPYWDAQKNLYPVARITNRNTLEELDLN